jgi:hypothetical protein
MIQNSESGENFGNWRDKISGFLIDEKYISHIVG